VKRCNAHLWEGRLPLLAMALLLAPLLLLLLLLALPGGCQVLQQLGPAAEGGRQPSAGRGAGGPSLGGLGAAVAD
jgi:hypothetical protein